MDATTTCTAQGLAAGSAALSTQPIFTFASSNLGAARAGATGIVTGVAAGTAAITASAAGITSNAVTLSVSRAPTPAPTGTTIIYKGSQAALNTAAFHGAIRADGTVAYSVLRVRVTSGASTELYTYRGTSKKVLTLPSTSTLNIMAPMCIDKAGNLVVPVGEQSTYVDVTSGAVTAIPFPTVDGAGVVQVVCPSDRRVIGSETDFTGRDDYEYAFAWTPGQSGVTAYEKVFNGCVGCNVKDANAAGDVLFANAIIRGGVTTFFPKTPVDALNFRGAALDEAGTVWGLSFTTTAEPIYLAQWTPGGVKQVTALPTGADWVVTDANNAGEVLLLRRIVDSKLEGGVELSSFVFRDGTLRPVTAPAGYQAALNAVGLDDQGQVLVRLRGQHSSYDDAWALIRS
ncbi:hypothetical protein GCM10010844_44220 [Deinococcus radiotolerans]|uniref:Uncharacterized protein n=1 Tax=Deinococcus radiotolerans TaxID=1309407 RepID=A0ABQ2FRX7_9DEIO|nr:hypothetical protein GCM10010844_44220 [Deinococcus radiotolerans]